MKEEFLYYVWQYKLFSTNQLVTTNGNGIQIQKTGVLNKNEGPDFLNAQLIIDDQLWAGNVEMHVKSSDWYMHKHEQDSNYDAVILHVVWEHDTVIYMANNCPLPTLVLKDVVRKEVVLNYHQFNFKNSQWIPCEKQINSIDSFLLKNWLERLYIERLEQKSILIDTLLKESNNNYEAVLFQLIAKNFGLKVNGNAFLDLAKSIDYIIFRKVATRENSLMALLFGMAGFLDENIENPYFFKLQEEFRYLKHKYNLKSLSKNNFLFFRMRPTNFPTIRIAQLVTLFSLHQHLFSKLLKLNTKVDVYSLLNFSVDDFWQEHYTFETTSKKSPKKLTKSFIDLLLINSILPLKFVYLRNTGAKNKQSIISLIEQVAAEKNTIITRFAELKIPANNAMESQALLTLKNNYCTEKRCLDCAIGNRIIRT